MNDSPQTEGPYSPDKPGRYEVRVTSLSRTYDTRTLPIEVWRPEAPSDRPWPLVVYSHGSWGSRLHASAFCAHLASHGYVVAAPDHVGNTVHDTAAQKTAREALAKARDYRPRDVSSVIDMALSDGALSDGTLGDGLATTSNATIDADRIGVAGLSLGGWANLAALETDARIRAALPFAPALGESPLGATMRENEAALTHCRLRAVPTLICAAELDRLVLLPALRRLFETLPPPKQFVVIKNIGHCYFVDRPAECHERMRREFMTSPPGLDGVDYQAIARSLPPAHELLPDTSAELATRTLGVAHFDAHLKNDPRALHFLEHDLVPWLNTHGVNTESLFETL